MVLDWFDALVEWGKLLGFKGYVHLKKVLIKIFTVIAVFLILLWLSTFLYGGFYYAYMPAVSYVRDVNFRFRTSCDTEIGKLCSFPEANISFMGVPEVFMVGQPYVILLELDMPESSINYQIGMFLVEMKIYSRHGEVVQTGWRSGLVHYKSYVHRLAETVFLLPWLVFGSSSQRQTLKLEVFSNYLDDPYKPGLGSYMEIQSTRIQLYSATLKIHAKFTGLRYLLFYWPVLSATMGITTNMCFLLLIAALSWIRYIENGDLVGQTAGQRTLNERRQIVARMLERERERENEQLRSALCDNDQTETIQPSSGQPHNRSSSQPSQDLLQESLEFEIASESPEDLDSPQNVEEDFEFASQIRHRHMRQEQQT